MKKTDYETPCVEVTEIVTETTILEASGSGLQDYNDIPWNW